MKEALLAIVTVGIVSALAPVQAEDNTSGLQPTVQTAPDAAAKKKQKPLKDRVKEFEDKVKDGTVTATTSRRCRSDRSLGAVLDARANGSAG